MLFIIETTKHVGVKRSFIRRPCIKQAAFLGLISGIISAALLSALVLLVKRDINQLFHIFDIKMITLVIFGVSFVGIFICVLSTRIVVDKLLSVSADELYY